MNGVARTRCSYLFSNILGAVLGIAVFLFLQSVNTYLFESIIKVFVKYVPWIFHPVVEHYTQTEYNFGIILLWCIYAVLVIIQTVVSGEICFLTSLYKLVPKKPEQTSDITDDFTLENEYRKIGIKIFGIFVCIWAILSLLLECSEVVLNVIDNGWSWFANWFWTDAFTWFAFVAVRIGASLVCAFAFLSAQRIKQQQEI